MNQRLRLRTAPAFAGQSFGTTGSYQLLQAVARFEVDPALPVNASLVNIGHAPRNARGFGGGAEDDWRAPAAA
jgi:hypothetical protein